MYNCGDQFWEVFAHSNKAPSEETRLIIQIVSVYVVCPYLKLQLQHVLCMDSFICLQKIFPSTPFSSSGKVKSAFVEIFKCKYTQWNCQWIYIYCAMLSCIWLSATPWNLAHQTPLSMRILHASILEWVAMPSSR